MEKMNRTRRPCALPLSNFDILESHLCIHKCTNHTHQMYESCPFGQLSISISIFFYICPSPDLTLISLVLLVFMFVIALVFVFFCICQQTKYIPMYLTLISLVLRSLMRCIGLMRSCEIAIGICYPILIRICYPIWIWICYRISNETS